jgi:ribonuclease R
VRVEGQELNEAILARGVSAFLATVEGQGRSFYVHSVDRRLSLRFQVSEDDLNGARDGDWAIARITRYPDAQRAGTARVERRLDPDRPLELACESAIARAALPTTFSAEALREAEAYGDRIDPRELQARGRVDLRNVALVTIDGDDARDFDDAVHARSPRAAGACWSRSPTSATTCGPARRSTPRRASAARASTSRTA